MNKNADGIKSSAPCVRILVSDLYPADGIGNFILDIKSFITKKDIPCQLYATRSSPLLKDTVSPDVNLPADINRNDILFYHHSNYDPLLETIQNLNCKKVYYYHNMTPGRYFKKWMPKMADLLEKGRKQFNLLPAFDFAMANSNYSLNEIKAHISKGTPALACPPVIAPLNLQNVEHESTSLPESIPKNATIILTVGRIIPHKRADLAVRTLAVMENSDNTHLLLTGGVGCEGFSKELDELIDSLPGGVRARVHRMGSVSLKQLAALYRRADIFLCISEHEGYCIPLLEAMLFDVPVVALAQGAITETLGDAGLLLPKNSTPEQLAQTIQGLINNPKQCSTIKKAQQFQATALVKAANGETIMQAISHCTDREKT